MPLRGQLATEGAENAARSAELAAHGYRVIRFWNNEVIESLDGVLQRTLSELAHFLTSPRPSPPRRRGS